jgi:hypothetical protein
MSDLQAPDRSLFFLYLSRKDVIPENPIGIMEIGKEYKVYPGSSGSEMALW